MSNRVKKIRKIRTSDINLELLILFSRKGSTTVLQVEKLKHARIETYFLSLPESCAVGEKTQQQAEYRRQNEKSEHHLYPCVPEEIGRTNT